jgi:hypothetical protein
MDRVNIPTGEPAEDTAQPAANAVETEKGIQLTPDTGEEESLIAGKFKSQEDLVKAYEELQKQFTQRQQEKAPTVEKPVVEAAAGDVVQQAEKAGVDVAKLNAEFAEKGTLSPETYADLESRGFPKEMVDGYIEGQKARATQLRSTLASEVGGEESLGQLIQWASANLTNAEIDAYNSALESGTEAAKLALRGINAKFSAARGSDPNLVGGENVRSSGDLAPFESMAEVSRAMRDPRYRDDPAYRRKVERRIAASTAL